MSLVPSVSTRKRLEAAASLYARSLPGSDVSRYLESRGIGSEAQNYFRLGVVVSPEPGDERFVGRISIPYLTPAGIVTMRFRRYPDESGDRKKYLSYQGEEGRIYNTEAFDRGSGQGFICITEGEFDAIAATSAGLPAVGIPGANSWCDYFWRAFRNYPTIYVLTDGDSPGDKLGDAIARSCQNVRVLKMPAGEDVNSFYLKEGGHGLRQFLGL